MTAPMSDERFEKLIYFLKGDKYAVQLCLDLLFLAHAQDDWHDGDERTLEDISLAVQKQWVDVPMNPFYQAHAHILAPMMGRVALLWLDSNKLENGTIDEKMTAFFIRNDLLNVIHYCILICGGISWATEVGPQYWSLFGPTYTKFQEFLAEKE